MLAQTLRSPRLLPRINALLLTLIILINGYIIAAPLLPTISYWWSEHFNHTSQQLSQQLHTKPTPATPAPKENRLIVPSMQLDAEIFEGASARTLRQGLWHRPGTSTPDQGGNTVIAGHRFTYTLPKGIFYYLNKVTVGQDIGVWWQGKKYIYRVTQVKVVPPTEVSVEDNTPDARLTLYTCTPLWSPHDRLVVVAKLKASAKAAL
jgi:sortase A